MSTGSRRIWMTRARHRETDRAEKTEIGWRLIDKLVRLRRVRDEPPQIGRPERANAPGFDEGGEIGGGRSVPGALRQLPRLPREVVELPCAEDLWVARQDLFGQARARAGHADDENRFRRRIALAGMAAQEIGVEDRRKTAHPRERGGLIIGRQLSLLGIGFEKMEERPVAVADVVERLAKSEMEFGPLGAGEGVRRPQQRPHGRQMRVVRRRAPGGDEIEIGAGLSGSEPKRSFDRGGRLFETTMGESDFSGPFIVDFGLRRSWRGPCQTPQGTAQMSRLPRRRRPRMPGLRLRGAILRFAIQHWPYCLLQNSTNRVDGRQITSFDGKIIAQEGRITTAVSITRN